MEVQKLLDYNEAAALLHIQPGTLRVWVVNRRIEYLKIGRSVWFEEKKVKEFLESCIVPAVTKS